MTLHNICYRTFGIAPIRLATPSQQQRRTLRYDCLHCEQERNWGFVDLQGNLLIPAQFRAVGRFSEGLAAVRDADEFSEGRAAVRVGNVWGYIDQAGTVIISPRYAVAEKFSDGLAPVRLGGKTGFMIVGRVGGRWMYIDTMGVTRIKLPGTVEGAQPFKSNRAAVSFGRNCGYIDTAGKLVIKPTFSSCDDFSEGLATVYDSGWQFIDPSGAVVLKLNYFQVGSFEHGLAPVTGGEVGPQQRFGYIDKTGKEIWKPRPAL